MDVSPASKASVKDPVLGPKADRWFEETQNWVAADSLRSLLALALPDKKGCIESWLVALADPSVCISSIDDVRRLDAEDIASLPVPPLVKGVFRYVLKHEHRRLQEAQDVLEATKARARAFTAPLRDRNMQPPLAGSKYFQDLKSYRLVLTKEEIEAGVRITAHRIETWCKGERIVLVAILKGAFMFLSDLCRTLTRPYSVYFVEASSYKAGRTQQEGVQIAMDVSADKFQDTTTGVPSKIVLLDELLDNGKTMQEVRQHFLKTLASTHTENDLLTVCLFSKKRAREYPEADITGIPDLPDLWLVGYGLDDRGTKRGWTELFAIPKVKIVETIEQEEVEKLLANLDEGAVMKGPMVFGLREFTHNQKIRYRVTGLDVHGGLDVQAEQTTPSFLSVGQTAAAKVTSKAEIQSALEGIATVKGKFEKELKFAFIQENVALVLEDNIFSGDNQVYAEMRCRLRRQIATSAKRFGVEGVREAMITPQQHA